MAATVVVSTNGKVKIFATDVQVGPVYDINGALSVFVSDGTNIIDTITGDIYTYSLSSLWTPADTTTYKWFDGNDVPTVLETGGLVYEWTDKGTNGVSLTQGTGSLQPTYASSRLTFASDGMQCNFGETKTQPLTVFTVHKLSSTVDCYLYDGIASANRMAQYLKGNIWTPYAGVAWYSSLIGGSLVTTQGRTLWNGATSVYDENGTAATPGNAGAQSVTGLTIGGGWNLSGFMAGDLCEIIVVDGSPDAATISKFQGYLAWKWDGINADTVLVTALPGGHTYKSAAPTI